MTRALFDENFNPLLGRTSAMPFTVLAGNSTD